MKNQAFAILVVLGAISLVGLLAVVVTPAPTGAKPAWYSIHSWGKHAPADKFDATAKAEVVAVKAVDISSSQLVHAAALEVDKARVAGASLPPSVATTVVQRTVGNAAGALGQVSPLTAAESKADFDIVAGLLAEEVLKRQAAEAGQAKAEQSLAGTSAQLVATQAKAKAAEENLATASDSLRSAFEERNALANQLEAGKIKTRALLVVLIMAGIAAWYFKSQLAGVGAALHGFDSTSFANIATEIEKNTSAIGQKIIQGGRVAVAKAEAEFAALHKTSTPPAPPPAPAAVTPEPVAA